MASAGCGAIFIGVQVNHPPADVAHIVTTDVAVRETAKIVFTVLALAGFTGMFVRNRHRFGVLGLAGYLLVSVGFLALFVVHLGYAGVSISYHAHGAELTDDYNERTRVTVGREVFGPAAVKSRVR